MDNTALHAVCHNPECFYRDRIRRVRLPHLGQGVYAKPTLVCECGWDLLATTPPPVIEPSTDLGTQLLLDMGWVMEPPC